MFLGHFSNLYTGMTSADLLLCQLLRLLGILCALLEQLCFIFLEVFWGCLLCGLNVFLIYLGAITGLQLSLLHSPLWNSSDVINLCRPPELCLTWIHWLLVLFCSWSDKYQICQGWDWAPDKSHGMMQFSMHRFLLPFKICYRSCLVFCFSRRDHISHTSCMGW